MTTETDQREIVALREALERIARFGTDWTAGADENLERVRVIAELAVAHRKEGA